MANLKEIESAIRDRQAMKLDALIQRRGYELNLYEETKDVHKKVYGSHGGNPGRNHVNSFLGIVLGDDFVPTDFTSSSMFTEGFLYCSNDSINNGHYIGIPREDTDEDRLYKVVHKETFGTTTRVIYRYRLASMENQ